MQEENTLCSMSGGAVTPESQLDESTSPADTTEDDLLPLKPWGRSQSLPAYADLIMVGPGPERSDNDYNPVVERRSLSWLRDLRNKTEGHQATRGHQTE